MKEVMATVVCAHCGWTGRRKTGQTVLCPVCGEGPLLTTHHFENVLEMVKERREMYRALQAMAAAIAGLASAQNLAAQEIEELIAEQIGKYSIVIRQECRVIHQIVEDMDYVVCNDGGKRKGNADDLHPLFI